MNKPFEQRNQSDTAKRKLKSLSKATRVPLDIVFAVANFTWDFDPKGRNEATGWVSNDRLGPVAKGQLESITEYVGLPSGYELTDEIAIGDVIDAYKKIDSDRVWQNFLKAAVIKNYAHISEFSSYCYLRGLNKENVKSLAWKSHNCGMVEIARNLFLKLFRGGAIERDDLSYLWCDLVLKICPDSAISGSTSWIEELLNAIETLPSDSGLKDLIKCCKGLVVGDKFFKQEVLQALAYADVIRIKGLPVQEMFIAEHRNELSPHFYSNEWTFPLRFWAINGGTVNRKALPHDGWMGATCHNVALGRNLM